jgi:hypothetical protein
MHVATVTPGIPPPTPQIVFVVMMIYALSLGWRICKERGATESWLRDLLHPAGIGLALLSSLILLGLFDYHTWDGTQVGTLRVDLSQSWHTIYKTGVWILMLLFAALMQALGLWLGFEIYRRSRTGSTTTQIVVPRR